MTTPFGLAIPPSLGSAGAVSQALEDRPASFSQVLQLLMATSIGRPALFEQEWNLAFLTGAAKR